MPDLTKIETALEAAQEAQTAYWDALRTLETELGFDLDDPGDLSNWTVESLLAKAVCATCNGKGFVNQDDSPNNAFEGLDAGPYKPCPDCGSDA